MRRKINVQLISISIIAIISTMLVMLFVFYDLFQTQVQDDLSANAIVLKNTGIFHSGNEKAIHMDYRELRVTWISSDGTVLYDNDADVGSCQRSKQYMDSWRKNFSDYSGDDTCDDDSVHYTGTLYDKESGKADRADGSGY